MAHNTSGVTASLPMSKQSSQPWGQLPFHAGTRKPLRKKMKSGSMIPKNDSTRFFTNPPQDQRRTSGGNAKMSKSAMATEINGFMDWLVN